MTEEDVRKKGCFLHVVRYETSFIRNELAKCLEYIQEYDVDPESGKWNRIKENAGGIIKEIENRRSFIARYLAITKDLTKNHQPELQPHAFIERNISYSAELLTQVSRKKDLGSDGDDIAKLMSDIQNQVKRLDAALQSLRQQEEEP